MVHQSRTSLIGDPVPDHLVVWLDGLRTGGAGPLVCDDELVDAFSFDEWLDRVHDRHPSAAVATVFVDPQRRGDWQEALQMITTAGSGPRRFAAEIGPQSLVHQRDWVRSTLRDLRRADDRGWSSTALEDAVLAVGELVANVEHHAGGWFAVDLCSTRDSLVLGVSDRHTETLAVRRFAAPTAPSGRGLAVVAGLSLSWGQVVTTATKTVWAQLPVRDR